ncbi:DUF2589 domain-containing protein [Bradyrhizobium oligotrophicum]|uniref:DUF2589 domain-containing protein n=1 Tax=Bradyrhizobium oligotrophicum TaxID=44255 RepID=UPI003EBC0697
MAKVLLPLHEIIGIPIADLVRAEMQAAQASMEFIENVGFQRDPKADRDDLGELRFVTFRYQYPDQSGKPVSHEVKVPLLSLMPLPLVQIARGEIELVARIEDVKKLALDSVVVARPPGKSETLVAERHEFIASVDGLTAMDDPKTKSAPRIRIKIEVKQSDLPAGFDSLLRKLDQNVVDKPK